jgi:hypothetical protein
MAFQRQYSMQLQSWNGVQDLYHSGVLADLRRQQEKAMQEQSDKWARVRGDVAGEESVTTQRVISEKDRDQIAADADVKRQTTTASGLEGVATMRTGEEVRRVDMQHTQDMKMKRDELGFQKDKEFTRLDVEGREDEQDATQIKRLVEVKKDMKAHAVDQDIKRFQGIDLEAKKTDSMTALELARIEAEKAKALAAAEADKARYSMDTFTRAEDRERAHQYQMTGLSSNMMQASKQNVPQTLVQGGGFTSTSVGGARPADEDTTMCPNCGEKVRKGKFCLSCGAKLG